MEEKVQYKGKGAFDAFLNLLSLISLGWMSISIGGVAFQVINKFFTKNLDYINSFSQASLKFNIASVFVITPVFLLIINWLHKNYKTDNLDHKSGIHRWLTYLMLLVSALTIIGRLVYQLFRFLDGDFTLAVILRTAVLLIIAGGIFGYYFYDLKRIDFSKKSATSKIFFAVVVVIAVATVAGSFFLIDSPQKSRMIRYNEKRVNHLAQIGNMIEIDYQQNKSLPKDLSSAKYSGIKDPENNQSYEYKIKDAESYELCATFSLAAKRETGDYGFGMDDWYYHNAGYQCFTRRVMSDKNAAPAIIK